MIDAQSLAVRTAVMVLVAVALIAFYLRRAAGTPTDALPSASGRPGGDDSETPVDWRKSTFSGLNGCVEIALLDGQIAVRDSKDRNGPILRFTRAEWDAFLTGVKQGQFG